MIMRAFDRDAALGRVGDDIELLKEIAQLFVEDEPGMVKAIEQAAQARDAKGLERSAHTLKGCVSNFSGAGAFEASLQLEKLGRASDFSGVGELLGTLKSALDDLRPELQAFLEE